jgi:two-component system CheB/CheR fusion protein
LPRYFDAIDGSYQVSKTVRSLVIFGQHDLSQRPPFTHIDLALCRNVLIYFAPEVQKHVLDLLACSLHDGGYLMLGKAETTTPPAQFFTPAPARLNVYRRHGQRLPMPFSHIPPPHHLRAMELRARQCR